MPPPAPPPLRHALGVTSRRPRGIGMGGWGWGVWVCTTSTSSCAKRAQWARVSGYQPTVWMVCAKSRRLLRAVIGSALNFPSRGRPGHLPVDPRVARMTRATLTRAGRGRLRAPLSCADSTPCRTTGAAAIGTRRRDRRRGASLGPSPCEVRSSPLGHAGPQFRAGPGRP